MRLRIAAACWVCALSFFIFPVAAVPPGVIDLQSRSGRFTIETNNAPLVDVLDAINQATAPHLRFTDVPDRTVTVRYRDMELDELLTRLEVSYVLSYEAAHKNLVYGWIAGGVGESLPFANIYLPGVTPEWVKETIVHIENLHSDDVPFNAMNSMWALYANADLVVPYLERALEQDDYQMQQFAAKVLMERPDDYEPPTRLLQVMIEGLADDEYPYGADNQKQYYYTGLRNAQDGLRTFLAKPAWVDKAEPQLTRALHSADGQQRFLAALILAEQEKKGALPDLVRILVPHLADNMLRSDGNMARHALMTLGPDTKPYLQGYQGRGDEQQERYLEQVLSFGQVVDWSFPHRSMIGWKPDLFPRQDGVYVK